MEDVYRNMLQKHAAPLAIQQETVCSGWAEGNYTCLHGHKQTSACNPYLDGKRWKPEYAPVCCRDDS